MTNEEKIQNALCMLQDLKWKRDNSWLANAMIVDEVIKLLKTPENKRDEEYPSAVGISAAVSSRPRAGLSDRLIALLGKRSGNARAGKTKIKPVKKI